MDHFPDLTPFYQMSKERRLLLQAEYEKTYLISSIFKLYFKEMEQL